jgi:chemotaxis protein methyltransferase CheR
VTAFTAVVEMVRQEAGIVLPPARETAILAALDRAAPGLGPTAFVRATSVPAGDPGLMDRLIDEVTVQETAFMRDRPQLDAIAWGSLGATRSRALRVWSVGCASGEEAYTLALLAVEAFAPGPLRVEVLGTDISDAALATAAVGRYGERAMRAVDPALRERYFDRQGDGSYLVGGRLRRLVRFRRHNLARGPTPPSGEAGFDLVICRNVLIYFDAALVAPAVAALRRALRPGGTLLLGHADALPQGSRAPGGPALGRPPRPPLTKAPRPPLTKAPRPPLTSEPPPSHQERLTAALDAAGRGDTDTALSRLASMIADNPLDSDAHFVEGLVALKVDRPAEAAAALRRALCADASFGLAAFTLGRAYDALGDKPAALRSYGVALRTLDLADDRHSRLLQQVGIGDMRAACRARLGTPP